jgi:hypothetical protein
LEPPFTDPLDRALADFANAREVIIAAADLGELDPDMVKAFLAPSRFDRALDELTKTHEETRRVSEESLSPDVPPVDPKTFAERVLRKALPPLDPDSKTPPPPPG